MSSSNGVVTPLPDVLVEATDLPPPPPPASQQAGDEVPSDARPRDPMAPLPPPPPPSLPDLISKTIAPVPGKVLSTLEIEQDELRSKIRAHVGQSLRAMREQKRRESRRFCGLSRADVFEWMRAVLGCADADASDSADDSDSKIFTTKKFLGGVEEFSCLTDRELSQLARLAEMRTYTRDEVIVLDEVKADGLYILMSGKATRAYVVGGAVLDDISLPMEPIEYQEAFGMNIPAITKGDEHVESTVTAVSERVECLWLPHLVVRMLNIQPRMDYEFVLILKNHDGITDADYKQQEVVLSNILQAGLHVTVLANTRNTVGKIILLLNAPLWLLAREDKLMKMERIVEYHSEEDAKSLGDEYGANAETMTAADRIAAFASILTRPATDRPPGVGLRGIENNQDPVIHDVFPLHDPNVTDFITSSWFKEALSASTRRLFLLRTKDHFGLHIAFYTAFVRLYCASLSTPCLIGVVLWVVWRQADYHTYMQALGIYGLFVAFVWAPSVLKRWKRYQCSLLVEWDLLQAKEVEYPNQEFKDYVVETINVANEGDPPDFVDVKMYDRRRRYPKYVLFGAFSVVCCVLLFVFVMLYCQWYIIAVMTPMCDDPRCPAFLDSATCVNQCELLLQQGKKYNFLRDIRASVRGCHGYCDTTTFDPSYYSCDTPLIGCFTTERGVVGTARWTYVLIQGIVLGLTLDIVFLAIFELIASVFNKWENYPTLQENNRRFVEKIFVFNWVGYFYWFFLLAFLYTPYGDQVQGFIREHIDTNAWLTGNGRFKFSRYWVPGLVGMDSAFVTPLIVTQALNLIINTFVPYLLRRAVVSARDTYLVSKDQLSLKLKNGLKMHFQTTVHLTQSAADLAQNTTHSAAAVVRRSKLALLRQSLPNADDSAAVVAAATTDDDLTEMEKDELAQYLSEKKPIRAADVEATIDALFANLSSHHSRMNQICLNVRRDDLDSYQVTSYDWIDRITQDIEHNKKHECIWEDPLHNASASGKDRPAFRLRLIKEWRCRNYVYNADRIMEESSMPVYSPQGDLLHMAIQFSYVTMFSVIWPFCALCAYCNNTIASRFDAIKMVIDCKRSVPRRLIGIGPWLGAFMFETLVATMVVPAIFVYVTGQMDSFSPSCPISVEDYGPVTQCFPLLWRLLAFCVLENVGIAISFFVYLRKSDISTETSIKIQEHSRRAKYNVRKSVRTIGEHILVRVQLSQHHPHSATGTTELVESATHSGEWRQGTVAWVKNGRIKVNFYANGMFGHDSHSMEHEVWLQHEQYALKSPIPVRVFEIGMPVLLASSKQGRWLEGHIVGMDTVNRFGNEMVHRPDEMHLSIVEGRNLRSNMMRNVLDPYCVITCGAFKHMTSIKRHTLNPLWNEQLVFGMTEKDLAASDGKVLLTVYNHDTLSLGECIGEAEIDLKLHMDGKKEKLWVPLVLKKSMLNLELLGNAVHKLALGDNLPDPQILLELQWIDTRFPAQVHVAIKDDGHGAPPRVLNRKHCEKRLCYGIHSSEIKHGRIYDTNDVS
ncbi:hypothetical protein H310_07054 [Aphanomyces invadans]|uniref:C2 domain-containing protein n=1 Tax=Aphanomyces invadans TaxID=157072 RepID=A0A024U3H2_9STRA|nr:hypothetical protein H310_07054 [Aphanomyces invadans]ETW00417.1 hypothetical protein H310_07054 [Aphanomyces invadans]|eukprot:XP_008870552.1 hypothetical protein H310_07054 [Aphanomyces invadans]